jgi:hypothetical protein
LVEGTAAIFAALSQILLSLLDEDLIFYIFFAECIIAAAVLLPLFWEDWKMFTASRKQENNNI